MKKLLCILCVLLSLCMLLTACGKEDGDKKDKSSKSSSSQKDTSKNNSSAEDEDPYNKIVLNWTECFKREKYENCTLTVDVKSAQLGDSTQTIGFNKDKITVDGEPFTGDTENSAIIKTISIDFVLDLLHHSTMYYDSKTNTFTASDTSKTLTVSGDEACVLVTNVEFALDEEIRLVSYSCSMTQEITPYEGDPYTLTLESVTFTLNNFGTTK